VRCEHASAPSARAHRARRHIRVRATAHAVSLRHLCGLAASPPTRSGPRHPPHLNDPTPRWGPSPFHRRAGHGGSKTRNAYQHLEPQNRKTKEKDVQYRGKSRRGGGKPDHRSPPSICPTNTAADTHSDPRSLPSERAQRPSGARPR
jgi:hypothetical protein